MEGGIKNASFIASLFEPWVPKIDPENTRIDCVFFDGASNVQKAGNILSAKFPRIHVQTCCAHVVSLFFNDLCTKLWQVRLMLVNYRRLYRLFGSGSMHSPYAIFQAQSKNFNGGRKVGLIRAAGTRMAGHAYAQCRLLRLREPLIATISSAAFKNLKLKSFADKVVEDLENPDMWEAAYILQRCLFPMIRVLRLGDKSACGGMSKLVYYVHKTDESIRKSIDSLRDLKYFADKDPLEAEDVDGLDLVDDFDDDASEGEVNHNFVTFEEDDDDESTVADHMLSSFGEQILLFWNKRREKLITPLSLAGWFCSPVAEIRQDVLEHEIGADRLKVEEVITKMYYPIRDEDLGVVIQTFWREFDDFQTRRGPSYSRSWIWHTEEITQGNCHLWHKIYSVPFTKVFGRVACRVCSKPLGCGLAERCWGAFKHLKSGKRSHLSGDKSSKQATIYGAACIDRSRALQTEEEKHGQLVETRWTDADIAFQMGLETWENAPGNVPLCVRPKRIFRAWIEDWEYDCISNNDPVAEARLLEKYGGLRWLDLDENELIIADEGGMEWQGGRNGPGWCIIGRRERDGMLEPWVIDVAIDEIAEYEQPIEMNVEIIISFDLRAANEQRVIEEKARKQASRKGSKRKSPPA